MHFYELPYVYILHKRQHEEMTIYYVEIGRVIRFTYNTYLKKFTYMGDEHKHYTPV